MTEMISQCPKCMTSFRVTEDQLTVAGGKVRCGYCMNVFMGHDYLISGGEQGSGLADEDVLRSLLDGGDESSAAESSVPDDEAAAISFDDVSVYDEPPAVETASGAADDLAIVEDDFGLDVEPEPHGGDSSIIGEKGISVESAADIASPPSADLIEPDLSLIEENLKFDEDDLRNSTDEDWALELLAELEGTGKYKDSTDASDAYVKELLSDTQSTLHEGNNAADSPTEASGGQGHRSGLGFEEIIVDAIPPSDDDMEDKQNEVLEQATPAAKVAGGKSVDTATSEFSAEFDNAMAAPALAQTGSESSESNAVAEVESVASDGLAPSQGKELEESDLFEDASSVYQQPSESMAESEPVASAQTIDELINEADDEPKRRKSDFLPQDIDISQSPVIEKTTGKFLDWKWIAGSVGMVLLMLVQYSYFYWNDLTASAKTRPMFVSLCNVVGCELPPYRSLRNVKTDQLSVRSHPDSETALIVDIILTNRAELAQPFPVLQLTFFDIRSQPVASRKFFPNEYLDGELRGLSSMPSDNPIRLALEIMDPGADAINYELNLLPTL